MPAISASSVIPLAPTELEPTAHDPFYFLGLTYVSLGRLEEIAIWLARWQGRTPPRLDRVEVLEGGTSNLYGNGAMGGVISFFGRPMSPGSMDLQVDGGSRSGRHAFAGAGVPRRQHHGVQLRR